MFFRNISIKKTLTDILSRTWLCNIKNCLKTLKVEKNTCAMIQFYNYSKDVYLNNDCWNFLACIDITFTCHITCHIVPISTSHKDNGRCRKYTKRDQVLCRYRWYNKIVLQKFCHVQKKIRKTDNVVILIENFMDFSMVYLVNFYLLSTSKNPKQFCLKHG